MTRICIQQTHSTHNSLGTYLKIKDPSKTGTYIIIYIKIYTCTFLPNSSIFEKSGHTLKLLIWQKKSSEIAPLICPRMNSLLPGPFCLLKLKKICAKWRKLTHFRAKIQAYIYTVIESKQLQNFSCGNPTSHHSETLGQIFEKLKPMTQSNWKNKKSSAVQHDVPGPSFFNPTKRSVEGQNLTNQWRFRVYPII